MAKPQPIIQANGLERRFHEAGRELSVLRGVDLEVPSGKHNIRMVDHRTIQSLVLKNVLYTCT